MAVGSDGSWCMVEDQQEAIIGVWSIKIVRHCKLVKIKKLQSQVVQSISPHFWPKNHFFSDKHKNLNIRIHTTATTDSTVNYGVNCFTDTANYQVMATKL